MKKIEVKTTDRDLQILFKNKPQSIKNVIQVLYELLDIAEMKERRTKEKKAVEKKEQKISMKKLDELFAEGNEDVKKIINSL